MSHKPWQEKPLWERVWLGPNSKVYLNAGKIIGHLGCTPAQFLEAAKKLPDYEQYRYENAARDLTVWAKREQEKQYELHAQAKKLLWIIIGPPPDHPEYAQWWTGRLISVRKMREEGTEPEFAAEPPVPLPENNPAEEPAKRPAKKPARKKKSA